MYTDINGRKETWLCGTTGTLLISMLLFADLNFSLWFRATLHYGVYDYGPEQARKRNFRFRQADLNRCSFKGEINA